MGFITNFPPGKAYDLYSEVAEGKALEFSYGNMQFKTRKDGIVSPYQTLIGRYYHALTKYIIKKQLTDEEYRKYYQRPKLLCIDLYGTPELWSGILYINNMVSSARFTKRDIKVFSVGIIDALDEVMTIYYDDLKINRLEVYPDEYE